MTYDARVVNVMMASPGDIQSERTSFHKVIAEWNAINAFSTKTVLVPITWELDVAPELGVHPQDLINSRILETADILVAAFWTRIGTPTRRATGGAVEEVQLALKRKKPVLIYFSDAHISPSKMDKDQIASLHEFKKWAGRKGLYRSYSDLSEFTSMLLKHLHFVLLNSDLLMNYNPGALDATVPVLYGLKPFSRALISRLSSASDGRFVLKRTPTHLDVRIGETAAFSSAAEDEMRFWVEQIVGLMGQGLLRDVTGRGEIFLITESGRTVGAAN